MRLKNHMVIMLSIFSLMMVLGTADAQDTAFPLKVSSDISRLEGLKGVANGQAKYDKAVKVLLPAIAKHLEDTFESYDIEKI